jgi:hypothetical protein
VPQVSRLSRPGRARRSTLPVKNVTGETTEAAPPSGFFKNSHFNLRERRDGLIGN